MSIEGCFAAATCVPIKSTLKAEDMTTFTLDFFLEFTSLDVELAIRPGAPSVVRIHVDVNVFFELQILFKKFSAAKFLNVISLEVLTAACLWASNFHYLSVLDVVIKVLGNTTDTEVMIAFKTPHMFLFIVHVTNFTRNSSLFNWLRNFWFLLFATGFKI